MKAKLSSKDWRMLSEYLDEQLPPKQISIMDERLRASKQLQQALDELRTTRALLRHAPHRRVPHNFTLTPEMVRKSHRILSPLVPAFSVTSALAALVTIFILLFEYIPLIKSQAVGMVAPAAPAAESITEKEVSASELKPSPPVIYWGGPPPESEFPQTEGLGGGRDDYATSPSMDDLSQPEPEASMPVEIETMPQPEALLEEEMESAAELYTQAPSTPEEAIEQKVATSPPTLRSLPSETPTYGEISEPKTGIAETDEQGIQGTYIAINPILGLEADSGMHTPTPFPTIEPAHTYEVEKGLSIIPLVSAFIAVLSGLTAWFIWKKSKT